MDPHKSQQKVQEQKIQHYLLTNDTSQTTNQFLMIGTMKAASKQPDRKNLIIITDDDYADDEADEPAHV